MYTTYIVAQRKPRESGSLFQSKKKCKKLLIYYKNKY